MEIVKSETKQELGRKAAAKGAELIREAIRQRGAANILVATGASQFETLAHLINEPDIAWNRVTAFHLDEWIDMPITHPASFRKYLWERFVSKLPFPMAAFHYVEGEGDPNEECSRLNTLIARHPIDVAFVGIGENGHLAFNDPPADFHTSKAFIVVTIDERSRQQQFGEGWFKTLAEVPRTAITITCPQIMLSKAIICAVPDRRKAEAVKATLESPVSPQVPATIMRNHKAAYVFLDRESASLIS
jgi:glucosamine-6-phosphate deaminase